MGGTRERVLRLDTRDASIAAIRAAAYRFGEVFSVAIEPSVENVVSVHCTFSNGVTEAHIEESVKSFQRELNDQVLRELVRAETKHLRAVIMAHAFSRTNLGNDG
jgi:His-Xaa-Ser system protein HxsD